MAWKRSSREKVAKVVEKFEPKFAPVAIGLLLLSAYLVRRGFERGETVRSAGELLDYICLLCGLSISALTITSWWLRRTAKVPEHFNPALALLTRARVDDSAISFGPGVDSDAAEFRFLVPVEDELEIFVKWSEEDEAIGAANDLAGHQRDLLYRRWHRANPRHFLMLQRRRNASDAWQAVGVSIVLGLPARLVAELRNQKMSVIDITGEDLRYEAGERKNACLLYDTLIFSPEYRRAFGEFKRWHSVFHAACFQSPTAAAPVTVWVEPDNRKLERSFLKGRYGAYTTFKMASGHVVYELTMPTDQSVRASQFVMLWSLLRVKGLEPSPRTLQVGTARSHRG